jgi:peptidyl-prolyl cis-trans isomerase C
MTRRLAAILAIALVFFASCKRKPATPPDVVVRIGDRMLTLEDLKRYLDRNAGTELAQMQPEVASAMLDQYVEEIVLAEYAATHGVEVPADAIATAVRSDGGATVVEKRDEMRRQKLIASIAAEIAEPDEAKIREYYEQHQNDFRSGEEIHVRQILVHDEGLADEILAKLKKGASFEDLSSQYSLAPNAKKGGDIGYVSHGELPKMFEDEIFALRPGTISNVIRTDSSFHIFKVDERRPPGTIDLNTASPVIRERLKDDQIRQRLADTVGKAKSEMPIAVLMRRLPFKYSGTLPKNESE